MSEFPSGSPITSLKDRWLAIAEVTDALRVFPRLYLGLFWYFMWDVHQWYTALHTGPEAVAPDIYANLVFGSISALTGFYMGTGRKWDG